MKNIFVKSSCLQAYPSKDAISEASVDTAVSTLSLWERANEAVAPTQRKAHLVALEYDVMRPWG